jgi:DNA-binding beta-propeller fold protein YncE
LLTVLLVCALSCVGVQEGRVVTSGPVQVILPLGEGTGSTGCGTSPGGFFCIRVPTKRLTTWHWQEGLIQPGPSIAVDPYRETRVAGGDTLVAERLYSHEAGSEFALVCTSITTGTLLWTWSPPEHWEIAIGEGTVGVSASGRYAAVALSGASGNLFPGEDVLDYRLMVAVIDVPTMEVRYSPMPTHPVSASHVTQVAVSDDGRYAAVAPWGGLTLFDITSGTTLFRGTDLAGGHFRADYVAFSPDGRTLYSADNAKGEAIVFETETRRVLKRWTATRTGKGYGNLIVCIEGSPDGNWVAVGTLPRGEVYLFDPDSDRPPLVIPNNMGWVYGFSFSPDCKRLAILTAGTIKVWDLPAPPPPPTVESTADARTR